MPNTKIKHYLDPYFFVPFVIAWTAAIVYLLQHQQGDFVLWLNANHTPIGDVYFRYASWFGNTIIYIPIFLAFLVFRKRREAKMLVALVLIITIVTMTMKEFCFPPNLRPKAFLEGIPLQFVEGVKVFTQNSFPSGHTSGAFGWTLFIALLYRKPWLSFLMVVVAISVGVARVYLVQHFLLDITVGSIIGILATLIVVYVTDKKFS